MSSSSLLPPPAVHRIGGTGYWIIPAGDAGSAQVHHISGQQARLLRFDDPQLRALQEYKYSPLPPTKKRIRLLKLQSATDYASDTFIELFEADYGNRFHIPTRINEGQGSPAQEGLGPEERDRPLTEMERKELDMKELKRVMDIEAKYEALSWSWGTESPDYAIKIRVGMQTLKKRVTRELALALKYLRHAHEERTLWIDAICIDQGNPDERNQQVQMMSRIYTRAKRVCIWLGESNDETHEAIKFVQDEVIKLTNIETLCSDKRYSDKWRALMMLMQRTWFSRRWVMQEIALASEAIIYCGPDSISWKDFAVAVELFVEVETATHRLSEVMQKDEKSLHIPGWFEYVSELGASQLVQATGRIFRAQRTPLGPSPDKPSQDEARMESLEKVNTIDPLDRKSLLSLEYLVTAMSIFRANWSQDAIYAMLPIARDATPFTKYSDLEADKETLVMALCDSFLEEKPFLVDYKRPYSDVCRDFIEFVIHRKHKFDPVQALDILCRPWALDPPKPKGADRTQTTSNKRKQDEAPILPPDAKRREITRLVASNRQQPEQIARQVTFQSIEDYKKQMESGDYWKEAMSSEEVSRALYERALESLRRCRGAPDSDSAVLEDLKSERPYENWKVTASRIGMGEGWDEIKNKYFPKQPDTEGGADGSGTEMDKLKTEVKDIELPSWVARASQAPFRLYSHPGMAIVKTGRANADPLVGHPQDGHRNYSAAQTKRVDLQSLSFKKRPVMGHYSLYVSGFKLDKVTEVRDASQGGNIPEAWLELAGWKEPYDSDPPDAFWRTVVADRGRENRNPPYYYARACRESVHKGGLGGGRVDTTGLINNEQNSIVAEFCRRVQAVIWKRTLFKTMEGRLGLANRVEIGDDVCILYGCTVPVILARNDKAEPNDSVKLNKVLDEEEFEDSVEKLKSCVRRRAKILERKKACKARRASRRKHLENEGRAKEDAEKLEKEEWQEMMENMAKANKRLQEARDLENAEARCRSEGSKQSERVTEAGNQGDRGEQGVDPAQRAEAGPSQQTTGSTMSEAAVNAEKAKIEDIRSFYKFKGECYLHDMMDGEALRVKFFKEKADHLFELR
jgi:hypothetical protein